MRRFLVRVAGLAAVGAVMVAGAGCGGSDSGSGSGTNGDKPAVNVGVVGTFTGPAAASETTPKVMEAWAKSVNAAGGINSQKVNVIVKDIGTNPGAGLAAVRSLIKDDHVVAIVDQDFNDVSWVRVAEASSVPVISASAGFATFASNDVFPVIGTAASLTYAYPAVAKTYGDKLAVGYAAEIAALGQQVALVKSYGAGLGVSLPVALKMSSSQPDYTAFCQQLKSSGAQSYFLAFFAGLSQKITDQCAQQGVRAPQILTAALGDDTWKTDPAFDNSVVVDLLAPNFDSSLPAIKPYDDALRAYAPDLVGKLKGTSGALSAWAALEMVAAAAEKAGGSVTLASVERGLHTMKGETLRGLISPVDYTGSSPRQAPCWFTWKVEQGKYVADSTKPTCAPESAVAPVEAAMAKSVGK